MLQEYTDLLIGGFQKSSLIDYPGKISAIIFTQGCNFRCPYCHNPELGVNFRGKATSTFYQSDSVLQFLKTRKGKLDGVVITGGEPTLHKGLPEFITEIKTIGFDVKLDTNGTNPQMLQYLISKNLVDYVAMDIKAPLEKYQEIVCCNVDVENIKKSIEILKTSGIDYEFRTTVVKAQLTLEDFKEIGELINDCSKYYLQRFLPTKTLDELYLNKKTYSDEEFEPILENLKKHIKRVELR